MIIGWLLSEGGAGTTSGLGCAGLESVPLDDSMICGVELSLAVPILLGAAAAEAELPGINPAGAARVELAGRSDAALLLSDSAARTELLGSYWPNILGESGKTSNPIASEKPTVTANTKYPKSNRVQKRLIALNIIVLWATKCNR